jgi:hypothetical protein
VERRPTLLESCSRAATAAEARFRVDYPNSTTRSSRIIALDNDAAALIGRLSGERWNGAHFITYKEASFDNGVQPDAILRSVDGTEIRLSDELDGADVAVMIATADRDAEGASIIGKACALRGIMTAGLVVGGNDALDGAVTAMRPYASVLVVAADEDYVPEMLAALRA